MDGLSCMRIVDGSNFSTKKAKRRKVAFVCLRSLLSVLSSSTHMWLVHGMVSIRLTVACGSRTHIDSKERTRPCSPLRTFCLVDYRLRKGRLGRMTFERQGVWEQQWRKRTTKWWETFLFWSKRGSEIPCTNWNVTVSISGWDDGLSASRAAHRRPHGVSYVHECNPHVRFVGWTSTFAHEKEA